MFRDAPFGIMGAATGAVTGGGAFAAISGFAVHPISSPSPVTDNDATQRLIATTSFQLSIN
nr:hypothetical protein [Sphingomonas sp. H160509]